MLLVGACTWIPHQLRWVPFHAKNPLSIAMPYYFHFNMEDVIFNPFIHHQILN